MRRPGGRARYREIARVLGRHGMGYLASALGLDRFMTFHGGLFGNLGGDVPYTRPEHLRVALEELGPTFIKLGQVLSTRADLLPPDYQLELARLQDSAPPLPAPVVADIILTELGRPIEVLFEFFDPEPLAAASIGQAHAARLPGGEDVVVKVRRPGVVERLQEDLGVLHALAASARRRWRLVDEYDVVGLVEEFGQTLLAETDYVAEAHHADRFADNFAHDAGVHVPRPVWDLTTSRVITLERVRGIKIDDVEALDAAGIERPAVAASLARMVLTMIFRHGFFHADPHPGNFFVEPGGRIAMVDFGMVGVVDDRTQDQLVWAALAFAGGDPDRHVDTLVDLRVAQRRVDRVLLRRDLQHLLMRYSGRPVAEIAVRRAIVDVQAIVRHHRLQLPPNFALLLKTLVMHEALVARLDPQFDFTALLIPYARRLVMRQMSPATWARWAGQATTDWARLALELPQQMRRLLNQLERGDLEIGMRPASFEPVIRRLERLANRVVVGVVVAALVIAAAILLVSLVHPGRP